jgi:hypothetical protein
VGELRKFAESHKINISDCLQKVGTLMVHRQTRVPGTAC